MTQVQESNSHSDASSASAARGQAIGVHKFGGSSVADADAFLRVADVLGTQPASTRVVVVSAVAGVTNTLVTLAANAVAGRDWKPGVEQLRQGHEHLANSLLGKDAAATRGELQTQFEALARHLDALSVLGVAGETALAPVHGAGELLSSRLLCALLRAQGEDAVWLDSREVLVADPGELGKRVDWEASAQRLALWRESNAAAMIVAPGFVARDSNNQTTTLGRNGSDFSAAVLAPQVPQFNPRIRERRERWIQQDQWVSGNRQAALRWLCCVTS